jgi:hypothetical protein
MRNTRNRELESAGIQMLAVRLKDDTNNEL